MSEKSDLAALLNAAAGEAEATRDEDFPADSIATKPNRNRSIVVSVRLTPEEAEALQEVADGEGIPFSTAARALIVRQLARSKNPDSRVAILLDGTHQPWHVHEPHDEGFITIIELKNAIGQVLDERGVLQRHA